MPMSLSKACRSLALSTWLLSFCFVHLLCLDFTVAEKEEWYTAFVNISYQDPATAELKTEKTESGRYGEHSPKREARGPVFIPLPGHDRQACDFSTRFPTPQPAHGPWIALIAKGNCTYREKIRHAASLNATAVVIYNVGSSNPNETITMPHPAHGDDVHDMFLYLSTLECSNLIGQKRTREKRGGEKCREREEKRGGEKCREREEERSVEKEKRREEERSVENEKRREEERSVENEKRREEERSVENEKRREEERSVENEKRREEERSVENEKRREEERSVENEKKGGEKCGEREEKRGGEKCREREEKRGGEKCREREEERSVENEKRGGEKCGEREEKRGGEKCGERGEKCGEREEKRGGEKCGEREEKRGGEKCREREEKRGGEKCGEREEKRRREVGEREEKRGGEKCGEREEKRGGEKWTGDVVAIMIPDPKGREIVALLEKNVSVIMHITIGTRNLQKYVSRTSVVFVSISFIVLMIISLAWLVFYYIQRFRYANARDRNQRRLGDAAKKAISKLQVRTIRKGDKETESEFDNCAVCIEGYKANDVVRILPCRTNCIPDRSRPGLTTTAIGAVDLQGAGGNWATVGRRSRGGRRVRRQREKRKGKSVGLRIGTLNVGTMTGKGRELADMMERRKVDILCVQETRWKGSKARSIGAGFKLFYYGVDSKRNGVGVVLKEEFVRNVLEVKRVSDRVMSLKLEIEGVMLNVVSGYAPQVGCELEEKERFWSELDEVRESIPTGERVVIGADFNGHVGEGNTGDEEVMGKFGVKERNLEGQMVVDFAKRMDMGVVNTYFQKREEHRVTYKSGGRRTQVDYILCRKGNLKEISDCKVVVGESVARQHRMVVCRMTLMVCKTKRSKIEKKTKWWKLEKEECCEEFRQKLRQALGGQVVLPDDWETTAEVIRETGRKVLGVSSGRRKEDKETWWWNEEVQDSIQRKRLAKKKWDMDRTEENRQEYKELQRRVKREVSKAKQKAYEELYTRLDTREGEKDLYRLARQRDRDGKDVQQVRVIKDRDGRVLTSEESVQRRWKEYFEELMNEENEREKRVEGVNSVEQKVDKIRKDEVRKALKRMKSGKAVGPDDIPVEVWKCLGEAAVEFLANLFNRVLESERMPEEWRRSVLVPIFKNKGDVQSCSNYRGIKLMSHTMKVWERVVEARLRKVVDICEQQYGFMPRKSTTDAIFALRILMEKYRDGQKELHCVFVDLEKAYDRVPREELWYCMRKSGVAEKYVRVVQDMYERSRTVVRCAVGQTEEFNVEVGLHQGSALSPFLFAIVMDQLSEEVRQESPWTMMFADDIVICSESREQVEENLERWRFALERRGMKVSRSKTEYMCVNEREGSGTVRLQGEEVKKVQEFKYLGSTVQSNGECGKEVKKRVQAGWNGWRKVSGVLCDQKISARIKGKVYRTVVRPAMLYGLETVSLRKRQESELEVAELKMLRHVFHKNCVDPWLQDHRTCPMCKMNILKALGIPANADCSDDAPPDYELSVGIPPANPVSGASDVTVGESSVALDRLPYLHHEPESLTQLEDGPRIASSEHQPPLSSDSDTSLILPVEVSLSDVELSAEAEQEEAKS
ncbi:hypothetical protein QTP86_019235 [Hemibagrus guttatus]|nr:hypothetical protein QTP86_019235 [Hemibagrus guttatus]